MKDNFENKLQSLEIMKTKYEQKIEVLSNSEDKLSKELANLKKKYRQMKE